MRVWYAKTAYQFPPNPSSHGVAALQNCRFAVSETVPDMYDPANL